MKRFGQWIILLWIAAVLVYPQTATTRSIARDTACEWLASHLPPQSLVCGFSLKDTPRAEASQPPAADTPHHSNIEPDHDRLMPVAEPRFRRLFPVASHPKTEAGLLPSSQGPPSFA